MNNEPVAWRCKKFYEAQEGWFYNENEIGEPLYTHPVKELTDEEIADMVCSDEYWELSEGQVIIAVHFDKFARAILRKAQE